MQWIGWCGRLDAGTGALRQNDHDTPCKRHDPAEDLLNRNFFTDAPSKIWATDLTYVPISSGFAYVSFEIDVYSLRILSRDSSTSRDTELVEQALQVALWQRRSEQKSQVRQVAGAIYLSDAGNEYTSQRYTQALAMEGLVPSISTIRDAFDNAAAETGMDLSKNEVAAKDSPFRTGPLLTESDAAEVAVE